MGMITGATAHSVLVAEIDEDRPRAAPPVFPFRDHRSMAQVMAEEGRAALRQRCAGCQMNVTFEMASECRNVLCPKRGR